MIADQTITAVIPVRAGSRRLPNKNILPFGDSNLLVHKIRQLKQVSALDYIVVSSDSDLMLDMAANEQRHSSDLQVPQIKLHKRAPEYCDEKTKTFNEVVEHVALSIPGDIIMWAPCVCPLTTPVSYQHALEAYKEKVVQTPTYDSVISSKAFKEYLFNERGPLNWDPSHHIPSQQLPNWQIIVNGFYIAPRLKMAEWKFVYGKHPYLYTLTKKEAVDIDDADDFEIAKALLNR
ncbi:MAG: hypothetical protein IKP96_05920 [Elusimicrobiaceae bacterium]|nr:hypothetical protein [Elusimicrobiaceae bacterium]